MQRNLPPLPALRTFEAAARHLSFKKAADELHVSPSAVSHAVQSLETHIGVKLFHRLPKTKKADNALILTDAGQIILPCLIRSFDEIEDAITTIRAQGAADILTIATAPIFARSWLMPRLHRFVGLYPDVDIRIESTLNPSESLSRDYDVGLMYGRGVWPGLDAHLLFYETMVPVCAPALVQFEHPLDKPEDLIHHTLIHSEARLITWSMWLENAQVRHHNPTKGLHFNRAAMAIDAAMNGLGVALEGKTAVKQELERGDLMIPFETPPLPDQREGYYLTFPSGRQLLPKVAQFYDWVLTEAQNDTPG